MDHSDYDENGKSDDRGRRGVIDRHDYDDDEGEKENILDERAFVE